MSKNSRDNLLISLILVNTGDEYACTWLLSLEPFRNPLQFRDRFSIIIVIIAYMRAFLTLI